MTVKNNNLQVREDEKSRSAPLTRVFRVQATQLKKNKKMFGIENSKDRLAQLKENYKKLRQDELNVSLAEKTCSDAWHLVDWVYSDYRSIDETLTKEDFRAKIYRECPEMKILHDLVNTIKHKKLDRPKVSIKNTKKHGGAYSSDYSKDYDVSRLEVHFKDQSKIDVDDLVKIAIDYWNTLIN